MHIHFVNSAKTYYYICNRPRRQVRKGDDIQDRLVRFGTNVMALCQRLPKDYSGRHVGEQLLRSGTAGAPNYAEARGAESTKDFIHKLRVTLKELNESLVWLQMARLNQLADDKTLQSLESECSELCRILGASIRTARTRSGARTDNNDANP
jgi:four helix bundle protein